MLCVALLNGADDQAPAAVEFWALGGSFHGASFKRWVPASMGGEGGGGNDGFS